MRTTRIILSMAIILIAWAIGGCNKNEMPGQTKETGILPSRFKVDIPSSLSNNNTTRLKSMSTVEYAEADSLKGNEIYRNLNTFIAVGEGAGNLVQDIILAIAIFHINKPMSLSYESKDDQRTKNLVVKENAEYAGNSYKFMLTITDALSEAEPDGGKAMQIFWNPSPIEGVAILKLYNIDRLKNKDAADAIFSIGYSEVVSNDYDSHMVVEIAGLPMPDAQAEPYAIHSLRMFVGKKGNNVDVFGNSDHPNARFFTQTIGFDWAFVASGVYDNNIGVAEVGLPPSDLDDNTRKVLLEDYSIKSVLTDQINKWFLDAFGMRPDSSDLARYLHNADAPGFFDNNGFIRAGQSPDVKFDSLADRIKMLTPYSPKTVHELKIDFN